MGKEDIDLIKIIVAFVCFAIAVTFFSCKTQEPTTTVNNIEINRDSTIHTTTETEVKETIKESDVAQSVGAGYTEVVC